MAEFINPSFLVSCPRPLLTFSTPGGPIRQVSRPSSDLYIRLYCETTRNVVTVRDLNSPLEIFQDTQTNNMPNLVHLRTQSQVEQGLTNVLSTWEIPQRHHESITHSILEQIHNILNTSVPTSPYVLGVRVSCEMFYCPDMDAFSEWCIMRWEEHQMLDTYPINDGMIPASEKAIKSSVVRKKMKTGDEKEGTACSICLEDFSEGSVTGCMPCSHMFHEECITNWLRRSHYCPLCRLEVPAATTTPD